MPRKSKGPRLYLRRRKGRPSIWVILDSGQPEVSTGCGELDRTGAEKALADYLADKHKPEWRTGEPHEVAVADVLAYYGAEKAVTHAHPELVGYHMTPLLEFFGNRMCDWLDASACRQYVAGRASGKIGRRKVQPTTARRELETLQAALRFCRREKKLSVDIDLTFPEKAEARQRWLTRSEVAALIGGALGFTVTACDVKTRKPVKWGRMFRPSYHVARFILIGLYTATRHEAILAMRWKANTKGGWFDLAGGVMYRRGQGQKETNKRRPAVPIAENLAPHLERWRGLTVHGPVEYHGRLIQKERKGFERARVLAGLDDAVTPHVLKHTYITWAMQRGIPIWEVAGFTGTSEKTIRDVYGHHHPDAMPNAKRRFRGHSLGNR